MRSRSSTTSAATRKGPDESQRLARLPRGGGGWRPCPLPARRGHRRTAPAASSRGTSVINVTGSFVLGVLTGLSLYHAFPADAKLVLGTGFCGAYTTFSTFTFETVRLAETGLTRTRSGTSW